MEPTESQEAILGRLRDCVHDFLEDGGDLRDAHAAISAVRTEVNETLRWQAELVLTGDPG